jgi:hypothetical protein
MLGLVLRGVGDLLASALGFYPVLLAWQRRAPKALLARMLLNLAADAAGGAIPVLGDVWDFLFRAHARNLALLRARAGGGAVRGHWSDTLVVGGALLVFVAALAVRSSRPCGCGARSRAGERDLSQGLPHPDPLPADGRGAGSGPLSRPIRSLSPSAGEVRVRGLPPQCARNRSASIAAMQPVPAAVTAWR